MAKRLPRLKKLLIERGMSQNEFRDRIEQKTGRNMAIDQVNRYVNNHNPNYPATTARIFAIALDVLVDDVVEGEPVKK